MMTLAASCCSCRSVLLVDMNRPTTPKPYALFDHHRFKDSNLRVNKCRLVPEQQRRRINVVVTAAVGAEVTSERNAAKQIIKIAAICGSLRKSSCNAGLLRSAVELSESIDGITVEHVDISSLPMLNTDLEVDGKYPPVVEAFRQKILTSDCYLFGSPEYNYSVTAPLKNALDWGSMAPNVWGDKAAAVVSTGGGFGGGRSQYHLRQIGVYLDLHFINKPEFVLNAFEPPAKFDADGNLIDPQAKENLKAVLLSLKAFTLRLQQGN